MSFNFDIDKRPEENLNKFFEYVKSKDQELGEMLERELAGVPELTREKREAIAKEAVKIIMKRLEAGVDE